MAIEVPCERYKWEQPPGVCSSGLGISPSIVDGKTEEQQQYSPQLTSSKPATNTTKLQITQQQQNTKKKIHTMAPLSYKALLALAISMLACKTNAAPYVYTTSATTSSADWVTEDLPLSDLTYFFFPTGTGDQDVAYYNPSGYDAYASSTSTSSTSTTSGSSTTMTTSTSTSTPSSSYSRVTLSDTSSSSASASTSSSSSTSTPSTSSTVVAATLPPAPLGSTSSYTVPTYFPASSYSHQGSASILHPQ